MDAKRTSQLSTIVQVKENEKNSNDNKIEVTYW